MALFLTVANVSLLSRHLPRLAAASMRPDWDAQEELGKNTALKIQQESCRTENGFFPTFVVL